MRVTHRGAALGALLAAAVPAASAVAQGSGTSHDNWFHHNLVNTRGDECVDTKENSAANLVESNDCTGRRDPGTHISGTPFRADHSHENLGAEVRVDGDIPDGGIRNDTEGNALPFNSAGASSSKPPRRARCATAPWQATPTVTRQEPVDTVAPRRTPHDPTPHNTRHNQQ
ncbi:hypothetical protein [Nocardiopsis sp. LOL_012]|uniref:hypothetical protein n=1 Tax=Nocardiopsis sp. LOL_012 TaxID=3345409 RepID=UPI003A8B78A9